MFRNGGFSTRPFFNGLQPTLCRDVVFGGMYTALRLQLILVVPHKQRQQYQWVSNLIAACSATVASGPFNYVLNVQYSTRSHKRAPSTLAILQTLATEAQELRGGVAKKLSFLQVRLRIAMSNDGATDLFVAIEDCDRQKVVAICNNENERYQPSVWVISTGTVQTTFDWSLWKLLPLHEAARRNPPSIVRS
jgi:hypothetical protein